jgi:hypothetical protein
MVQNRLMPPDTHPRDPFRAASSTDVARAVFHAVIAVLFTVPMWIFAFRAVHQWGLGPTHKWVAGAIWSAALSSAMIWGVPAAAVLFRWRQRILRHPERPPTALVRTYATSQALGIVLGLPFLLWFGVRMMAAFF